MILKNCDHLKGDLSCANFRAGAMISWFLRENKCLFCDGFSIYYNLEQQLYLPELISDSCKSLSKQHVECIESDPIVVDNIDSLLQLAATHEYICCDREFEPLFERNTIFEQRFCETLEGQIWQLILQLDELPNTIELFCKLGLFLKREYSKAWRYIDHSPVVDRFVRAVRACNNLQELYLCITGHNAAFYHGQNKNELLQLLANGIVLLPKNQTHNQYLIDKSLSSYFDNVLYIGKDREIAHKHVIFSPQPHRYQTWENQEIILRTDSLSEIKMHNKNQFEKLSFGIWKNEEEITWLAKTYALESIIVQLTGGNRFALYWREYFSKSGVDFVDKLTKIDQFVENFFDWLQNRNAQFSVMFGDILLDCIVDHYVVFFYWNHPKISSFYILEPKAKIVAETYPNLQGIILISSEKITELDLTADYSAPLLHESTEPEVYYWANEVHYKL